MKWNVSDGTSAEGPRRPRSFSGKYPRTGVSKTGGMSREVDIIEEEMEESQIGS